MTSLWSKRSAPDWPDYMGEQAAQVRDPRLQRFFTAGCPDPDTPVGDLSMAAMDFETTGLDERQHAIVSIGVVPFTLTRIRMSQGLYRVVRPPRPLSEQSITFHRITHAEVARAPDLDVVLEEVLDALAGRLVVVHFRQIERNFLNKAVEARTGENLLFPVIDTMSLEADLHRHSRRARLLRWLGRSPASIRLHDSRQRYGLPGYQAHHALTDALATAELLQAQIARHFSAETPVGELWC